MGRSEKMQRRMGDAAPAVKKEDQEEAAEDVQLLDDLLKPKLDIQTRVMRLADIGDRYSADTRPLDPFHIVDLAESIAFRLIHPPTVDSQGRLVVGGHRRAAAILLTTPAEERGKTLFELCPESQEQITPALMELAQNLPTEHNIDPERFVVLVDDHDSSQDTLRARILEATENTHRKAYKRDEIRAIHKWVTQDERFVEIDARGGRPPEGKFSAKKAVALMIGRSPKTVQRALNEGKHGQASKLTKEQKAEEEERRDRERLIIAIDRYLSRHAAATGLGGHTMKVLRKALGALRDL